MAQSRSYSYTLRPKIGIIYTLGPKRGIIYILGALQFQASWSPLEEQCLTLETPTKLS